MMRSPRRAGRRRHCGWTTDPSWFVKRCNGSAKNKVGLLYIPPGTPWNNDYIESFNNRLRKECRNCNHWNTLFEARVAIGDFKTEHNQRHRHSLGPGPPNAGRVRWEYPSSAAELEFVRGPDNGPHATIRRPPSG
jgi:transposase InsO family protein